MADADKKISQLDPVVDGFDGEDEIALVRDGANNRAKLKHILADIRSPMNVVSPDGSDAHVMDFRCEDPVVGDLTGYNRTYIDKFGAIHTQAWVLISGIFKDLGDNNLLVINPGATIADPHTITYNAINGGSGGMLGLSNDIVGPNLALQDNSNRAGYWSLCRADVADMGSGYVVNDVLTISGGTVVGGANAATVTVTSVNATGQITGVTITEIGSYIFAGPPVAMIAINWWTSGTVNVTGGTGSGATLAIEVCTLVRQSTHFDALDYARNLRFVLEGSGMFCWGEDAVRQNFFKRRTNLYQDFDDADTMTTDGYWKAKLGFKSSGRGDKFGHRSQVSLTRALPTSVGDTIEIGRLPLTTGGSIYRIGIVTATSSVSYDLNTAWLASQGFEGVDSVSGTWVEVVPRTLGNHQSAPNLFGLDAKQSASDGTTQLRIRMTGVAAGAETAKIVIDAIGFFDISAFVPSTATAAGVSAPTKIWQSGVRERVTRCAYTYITPANGDVYAWASGSPQLIVDPAADITNLTIRLPQQTWDGEVKYISFIKAVTSSLAIQDAFANGAVGGPSAVQAGSACGFMYRKSDTKWYLAR